MRENDWNLAFVGNSVVQKLCSGTDLLAESLLIFGNLVDVSVRTPVTVIDILEAAT